MVQSVRTLLCIALLSCVGAVTGQLLSSGTPGQVACNNLVTILGYNKVASSSLDVRYVNTVTDYWSTQNSQYQPSCIVYPASAQDVSVALQQIQNASSRFAIKAGGHNPNKFFSSVNQGVLIDLGSLTDVTYDQSTGLVTYQPGPTFGTIYQQLAPYNVTVVGARLSGVGTGLALGGGLSYLSPQYGMACDGFRELEVVLPNGTITTASPQNNPDLFFAMKGGGGNAYGVVTKYTVQSRPIGTFYAGNIIYLFNQTNAVADAIHSFTMYNTDPKASIIGTYEKLPVPTVINGVETDEAVLMFLVYDGPNAGNVFDNFTSIPYIFNSMRQMTYYDVVNMPIGLPIATEISKGNNIFRVGVHRVDDNSYQTALHIWADWCEQNKQSYQLSSIDFQPIPYSLTQASKQQYGGNAMQMPDGPYFWLNYLLTTPPTLTTAQYQQVQTSFAQMVQSAGNAAGLPLFINDASYDQNPLSTFSTYSILQQIKTRYDPDNFFATYTGGWSFA